MVLVLGAVAVVAAAEQWQRVRGGVGEVRVHPVLTSQAKPRDVTRRNLFGLGPGSRNHSLQNGQLRHNLPNVSRQRE